MVVKVLTHSIHYGYNRFDFALYEYAFNSGDQPGRP